MFAYSIDDDNNDEIATKIMAWSLSQLDVYLPPEVWDSVVTHVLVSGMMIGHLLRKRDALLAAGQ